MSSQPTGVQPLQLADVRAIAQRIAGNVERVLVGKPDAVQTALITLLAEGHLLIEEVPRMGKTSLAKALARSVDCTVSRIQFCSDHRGQPHGIRCHRRRQPVVQPAQQRVQL